METTEPRAEPAHTLTTEQARAINAVQWAGMTAEQISAHMSELGRKRAAKLSPSNRRKIAKMGGKATAGKKRAPGAGRPRKTPPIAE